MACMFKCRCCLVICTSWKTELASTMTKTTEPDLVWNQPNLRQGTANELCTKLKCVTHPSTCTTQPHNLHVHHIFQFIQCGDGTSFLFLIRIKIFIINVNVLRSAPSVRWVAIKNILTIVTLFLFSHRWCL